MAIKDYAVVRTALHCKHVARLHALAQTEQQIRQHTWKSVNLAMLLVTVPTCIASSV